MKKIYSFKIVRVPDYDADLSYLGTFDDVAKSDLAVEHEPGNPRVLHWFNPQPGTVETKDQAEQVYDRMVAYEKGEWGMVSVKAIATIGTSDDGKVWLSNEIQSDGVHGVEDDMDSADIETEEAEQLISTLKSLGITREEIEEAQHKD